MKKSPLLLEPSLVFRSIPLFAHLNPLERKFIYERLEVIELDKGEFIYREGDPPGSFYAILSGKVQIFVSGDSLEKTIEYLYRGKYFGFISLLTNDCHSVSARASTNTILVRIKQEDFDSLLKKIPRLALHFSKTLSRRLKRKELHPKTIFESTIVSVFADASCGQQGIRYAWSLAFALRAETLKKVICVDLVDLQEDLSPVARLLGQDRIPILEVGSKFFDAKDVFDKVLKVPQAPDFLSVICQEASSLNAESLISLLTLLINDYHFCVIHLPARLGPLSSRIMAQSDVRHVLFEEKGAGPKDPKDQIDHFVSEEEGGSTVEFIALNRSKEEPSLVRMPRRDLADRDLLLASLNVFGDVNGLLPEGYPKTPYLKAVRRMARQIGDVLVGLALGSGSAMGMAHIGVLKLVEEEEIPVDIVAGSSIGALIGALWCLGYRASEIEALILENKDKSYFFGLDDLTFPLRGLLRGRHVRRFLARYLKDKTFSDLKRPLKIVVCDCMGMRQEVLDSGSLLDAVFASISVPGIFSPYRIGGRFYLDGGILNPLPTDVLIETGVKKIISVNVLPSPSEIEATYELLNKKLREEAVASGFFASLRFKIHAFLRPNIFDIIVSTVQSMEYLLAEVNSSNQSDIALHPEMTNVKWSSFREAQEVIGRGYREARLHLKSLQELTHQIV